MSINRPIQLGLCCLNTVLRDQKNPVYASRQLTQKRSLQLGDAYMEIAKERGLQNLKDIMTMMEWNEQNGIKVFRLSSDLLPQKNNPKLKDYGYDFAKELFKKIGELSKKYNQRLTFHPAQFNVLGTPNEKALENTIRDLTYHATMLDLMELPSKSVMVIHGGGVYGDKHKAIERWCENYLKLPDLIKKRLVLENCERIFNIKDCLQISEKVGVPVVFDTHHHECYQILHPEEKFDSMDIYIPRILESWKKRNIKPKFHVSEQGTGRVGHHSDYIEELPEYLLSIPEKYNTNIDIMIEAKAKEKAIFKLYAKYPFLDCKLNFTGNTIKIKKNWQNI